MTGSEIITQAERPADYKILHDHWIKWGKPGWVVMWGKTYVVVQLVDETIQFRQQSGESLYESTGIH